MRYAVIGGDMRFAHLTSLLAESGRDAAGFFQEKAGGAAREAAELAQFDCVIGNYPPRFDLAARPPSPETLFSALKPGSVLLLCGPGFPEARRWDLQYVNLWRDEALLCENARLTAEAAAASALRGGVEPMAGLNCMVVGCGRVGCALADVLLRLGARVTVVSRDADKRAKACAAGARAVELADLADALPGMKLVFSTPPAPVIGAEALARADADVILIDLASPPYGVDLEAAARLGLRARREPGLPGRYCPLSAARALYNAVIRWEATEIDD